MTTDAGHTIDSTLISPVVNRYPASPSDLLPSGIVLADCAGMWRFDNTGSHLNDRTANGTNFAWLGGTGYSPINAEGVEALHIKGPYLKSAVPAAELAITDDLTLELFIRPRYSTTAELFMMSFEGAAAHEDSNVLYILARTAQGSVKIYQEHDTNVSEDKDFKQAVIPDALWTHLVATRASNGLDWIIYLQGLARQSYSFPNAPTGGNDGIFTLAGGQGGASRWIAGIAGAAVFNQTWTPAQVAERYASLRGPIAA